MTEITIFYNEDCITKIEAIGHADYASYGNDIVCASISTLLQTAVLAVKEMFHINLVSSINVGDMELIIPNDENVQLIIKTMIFGLKDIESGYPNNLKIKERKDVY